nr:MAG TPA: hypothetical protein [Caudoviricetes sp.]
MNYVRFMSINELKKYLSGAVLKNSTDWKRRAKNTGSVGFCFFDDSVEPEERLEYLAGVVNTECVAVFERRSTEEMKKTSGMYRDPNEIIPDNLFDALFQEPEMIEVPEYSVEKYSQKDMRLIKAGAPYMMPGSRMEVQWFEW